MTYLEDSNKWPYTENLDEHGIMSRVDLAKLAVYNMVVGSTRINIIHIEDFLNIFLGLVQHPLNFVFFDSEYNIIFHLCKDPKHRDSFERYIENGRINEVWNKNSTFELFNDGNQEKVNIAIIYMNTKYNEVYFYIDNVSDFGYSNPKTEKEYISLCAHHFFQKMWDSKNSAIRSVFMKALYTSISNEKMQYHEYLKRRNSRKKKEEVENDTSIEDYISEEYDVDIQKILNFLADSMEGTRESSAFTNQMAIDVKHASILANAPNQILAFRSYNNGSSYRRYNKYYNYSTRYVISDEQSIEQYITILNKLKKYTNKKRNNFKYKYGNIDVSSRGREKLIKNIDKLFWMLLASDKYTTRELLTEIIASPVGDDMRTLVDPVYQTGLIHFNRIFEEAGLDRIDDSVISDLSKGNEITLDDLEDNNIKDLMRIVFLYYLISDKCRANYGDTFEAQDILCVMYPIKIRGVCWAVVVQPYVIERTYLDNNTETEKNRHGEQLLWISIFVLTSYLRRRQFSVIDRKCWGYASRYITDNVNRCIVNYLGRRRSTRETINDINQYMKSISAYMPYSFPKFDIQDNEGEKGEYRESEEILSNGKQSIYLTWDVLENKYYTPSQKWDRVSTRKFDDAIKLAVNIARREFYKNKMLTSDE